MVRDLPLAATIIDGYSMYAVDVKYLEFLVTGDGPSASHANVVQLNMETNGLE